MSDLNKLKRNRRAIIRKITSVKATVLAGIEENPSSNLANELLEHLKCWKEYLTELKDIDDRILDLVESETPGDLAAKEEEFIRNQCDLNKEFSVSSGKVKTLQDIINEPNPSRSRSSVLNASFLEATLTNPTIKLQDIPVPDFDGKIENFPDWYHEFTSMIDSNDGLSNFQKMYLLKRAMKGDAATLLKDYPSDPEIYPLALEHIKKSYFNRRRIIAGHFADIVDLSTIKLPNLRETLDKVQRTVRGLKVCGLDTIKLSPLIAFLVSRKLPEKIRVDWENSNHDYSSYPSFEPMVTFLSSRCFAYETSTPKLSPSSSESASSKVPTKSSEPIKKSVKSFVAASKNKIQSTTVKCVICTENHYLNHCKQFLEKSPSERFDIIKGNKLCIRCFSPFHTVSSCTKRFNCSKCQSNHNTLLHSDVNPISSPVQSSSSENSSNGPSVGAISSNQAICGVASNKKAVILSTAIVKVINNNNHIELARVLFDQGSQTSLISREFCKRAKLNTFENSNPTVLVGINSDAATLNSSTRFLLKSRFSDYQIAIEAELINKIPYQVYCHKIVSDVMGHFRDLKFAETYDLPYTSVDIVLGAEYVEFILNENRKFIEDLCIRDSKFGYVILGSTKISLLAHKKMYCGLSNVELSNQFNRFCRIEDISDSCESKNETILEHELIREHFENTYRRDETGRFILRLPTKPTIVNLNGSFGKAEKTLLKSERCKSEVIRKAYCEFMSEYEQLGHMSKLSSSSVLSEETAYYIPHHIVVKETSSTTKYRVVFNASCVDNSNMSLNDNLLMGPVVQPDLFSIVINFRNNAIAISADIAHMYRQILIDPSDRKYQRILWRFDTSKPIEIFELNTLTYGTGPASFLATNCVNKAGDSIAADYPNIAESIRSHFYVDNYMSGAKNIEDAIERQRIVHHTLESHGFPLRKYMSNSSEFLATLEPSLIEPLSSRMLGGDSFIYVLGLVWCPEPDTLHVMINIDPLPSVITKRIMLSDISKIYDVLGMLSPVTVKAKILLQNLWREGIGWDEPISSKLESDFRLYRTELAELSKLAIPRFYYLSHNVTSRQLVCLSDASKEAYSAVIYLRSVDNNGSINVTFVCAKTRVAPLKSLANIHRLELLGTLLLAELSNRVCRDLKFDRRQVYYFSDSQVALSWINRPIETLKQYVSSRVSKIQRLTSKDQWFYIDTKSNPADLATRGISVRKLLEGTSWTCGPDWIKSDFDEFISSNFKCLIDVPEIQNVKSNFNVINFEVPISILTKFSSLFKCINVMSYVLRFINNVKIRIKMRTNLSPINVKLNPSISNICPVSASERKESFIHFIHASQLEFFDKEYHALLEGSPINKRSRLFSLNVKLDKDNLIRIGGRLSASNFSYDTKHPIVLSRNSRLVELFVVYVHFNFYHASKSFILNYIRSRFWIVGGLSSLVKKSIRNCVPCTRIRAEVVEQFMSDLPKSCVSISRTFSTTGVDFSGAFHVKCINHRSVKYNKVYIAFFVCFATRAVHCELAEDLSTEAFAAVFDRFCSRRGLPNTMYSDNATNFVGYSQITRSIEGINWKFISPRSPHQGGLWEAAVKSGKSYISKAIGNQILSYNELNTIVIKVEGILNSRPMSYRSNNNDVEPLTPAHFLIGSSLYDSPSADDLYAKLKVRYRLWRSIIDSFWYSWSRAYLSQLQSRTKWNKKYPNLKLNDVVIIKSPNLSVMQWPLGRIVNVYPDSSGIVRNVSVRTHNGEFRRSVQQLVLLPVNP